VELRGLMTPGQEMRIWRDALTALVAGFAIREGGPADGRGGEQKGRSQVVS